MKYNKIEHKNYNIHYLKTNNYYSNLIRFDFISKYNKEDLLKEELLLHILSKGYYKKNKIKLLKELNDLYNVSLGKSIDNKNGNSIFSLSVSFVDQKYLDIKNNKRVIKFLLKYINNPIFKEELTDKLFNNAKEDYLNNIKHIKEEKVRYSTIKLSKEMDDNNDFSNVFDFEDKINSITKDDIINYYYKLINKSILEVFVIGNINASDVKRIEFDKEKYDYKVTNEIYNNTLKKEVKIIEEELENNQSILQMGYKFKDLTKFENEYVVGAFNYIFGGGAHSNLFKVIREIKGYCYFIYSHGDSDRQILRVCSGLDYENIEDSINEVKNQLNLIINGKFTNKKLNEFKSSRIKAIKNGPNSLGEEYLKLFDKEIFNFEPSIESIKNITKEDIINVASKLHLDTIYIIKAKKVNE